ncbi:MAG: nucleotidyltransferase domain-containing protein [Chloroflexi bacterium]|nr:MAG: nucleotidyltransferase domain-containing protein [Chloroflexota bacterium]
MVDIEALKREILERLRPLDPERVILFGSYAYGNPTEDSDIDLYVVTRDELVPVTYEEKRKIVRRISRAIFDLRMQVPIDLIVHTRRMSELFFQKGGAFAREIQGKGVVWYGEEDRS